MVVEGVLRVPASDAHLDTGLGLFYALAKNSRLYLMSHEWEQGELESWLGQRQMNGHLGILRPTGPSPEERIDALERIRSWRVELVIESDPACAAREIAGGWNTLLHTHAAYTLPQWRPDHNGAIRPWDALTGEISRQKQMFQADQRNTPDPQ